MSTNRIIEAMNFESDTLNWKYSFKIMCSKYGKDFIEILIVMWEANGEGQTEEEFCIMNNLPKEFFNKHIKK